ncbi:hypothetical protein OK074_3700 [Actinobacteria bacterium OK074]|nr:hypothetical protein OK074_3700 [Actinobacteria bacterium OK074]
MLHALSDPIRRDIARVLYDEGSRVCGQLDFPGLLDAAQVTAPAPALTPA